MRQSHDGKVLLGLGAVALAALMIVAINKTSSDHGDGSTVNSEPARGSSGAKNRESVGGEPPMPAIPTLVVRGDDFVAKIEGIFEVESEGRAVPITELQVNP